MMPVACAPYSTILLHCYRQTLTGGLSQAEKHGQQKNSANSSQSKKRIFSKSPSFVPSLSEDEIFFDKFSANGRGLIFSHCRVTF
ncbi:hypothetical protein CSA56_18390 [candidate division KSB3 bacterium]|uniref:Uncharacterized protein n=1 Tax=candidate division KSB3 bacterium TaxID=2044937 RepID=A0A2G6K6V1_9BACT|nr:MAG: hypothetical protein CSA56_18390 [candidate division KSB3 bacterium]